MAYIQGPIPISKGGTGASTQSGAQTALGVAAATAIMLLNGTQAMTASMSMGNNNITNLLDPTSAQMAATKNYVDNAIIGINVKTSVRVATPVGTNITLSAGAPNTLDGVTLQANDYVLVKNQTTASQNGIYQVTTLGTGSNGTWTRAAGDNVSADFVPGMYIFVGEGSTNGSTTWILTTDETITLGTTSLTFVQFAASTSYSGSNGVNISGSVISAVAANSTITTSGGIAVSPTYPGNTSLNTLGTVTVGTWNGTAIGVANGGTGATGASSARSNLSAAPNTPIYWLGGTNGELSSGVVPSGSGGVLVTASTGVIGIDTTVVATTSNALTMSNKTMTAPTLNTPVINYKIVAKVASYALLVSDQGTNTWLITSAANCTLPASGTLTSGWSTTIKNKKGSTAVLSLLCNGSDTGENSEFTSSTSFPLNPGDSLQLEWDGSEWIIC